MDQYVVQQMVAMVMLVALLILFLTLLVVIVPLIFHFRKSFDKNSIYKTPVVRNPRPQWSSSRTYYPASPEKKDSSDIQKDKFNWSEEQ